MNSRPIAFIGAGNMTRSIISGLVQSGYPAQEIIASNPSRPKLDALENDLGIQVTQDNHQAVKQAQVIVLAVKPQLMEQVTADLADNLDLTGKVFISIAAGINVDRLLEMLKGQYDLIRTMPNTPSALGKGMTGLYAPSTVSQQDREFADYVLSMVGETVWVDNEADIDLVIATAGSSPAYFFLFLEAMQDEAIRQGLDKDKARKLVQQAMLGSAEMVCHNPDLELSELRAQVTSKGGTTAQAVNNFEKEGLREVVARSMQAAITRAQEMSKLF